jgi:hypothetical protein
VLMQPLRGAPKKAVSPDLGLHPLVEEIDELASKLKAEIEAGARALRREDILIFKITLVSMLDKSVEVS